MAIISKLSNEIISEVFHYYIAAYASDPFHRGWSYKWTKLRLVCGAWNEILKAAVFWNKIPVTSLRAMKLVIERGMRSGFEMRGSLTSVADEAEQQKFALMLGLAGEIRIMDLSISEDMIRASDAPTPKLNHLVLRKGSTPPVRPVQHPKTLLTRFRSPAVSKLQLQGFTWTEIKPLLGAFVEDLTLEQISDIPILQFGTVLEGMKKLRRLSASDAHLVVLHGTYLSKLERLKLFGLEQQTVSGNSLLNAVGNMQQLERLDIQIRVAGISNDAPVITLPSLTSLSVVLSRSRDVAYLGRVIAPRIRHFQLSCLNVMQEDDDELEKALRTVRPLIRQLMRNIHLHTARIFSLSSQDLHLTLIEHPTSHVRPEEGIHFELCIEDQGRMINYMSRYLHSLWPQITALYVRDGHYSGKDALAAWHKLFRTMKRVESVHLERKGVKVMPEGLHHYARNGIADVVFPVLRILYLESVCFRPQRRKNQGNWEIKAKPRKGSFLEDLKRSFRLSDAASENNLPNAHDGALDVDEAVVELEDGTRRTQWTKPKDDGKFRLVINNAVRLYKTDVEKLNKPGRMVIWDSVNRRK
ncbi:hypothetical protein OE88DRAFT_389351 [Heliocybe sulcata]|uniref:F-box domain-containing protein n=1 Tax=Heliocybe sulcata TaxID=5364 RepID=A0A5C3MXB8_9AGAM|nr:hypothetical protein OE88DRAFT_389351 [Heliocybe sulcata]